MSGGDVVLVAVAGLLCGAVNAVAGGGSLILFPAMVATGMGTLAANVTNSIAAWPGYVGSCVGFREELRVQRDRLPRLGVAAALGTTVGCWLLLVTPSSAFDAVVPFLVLAAAGLLAIQPTVARRVGEPSEVGRRNRLVQGAAIFLASIYGGYFGAALGVIYLGVLALTIAAPLRRLNGLKAGLSVIDASVSVVVFGLFGPVQWVAVAVAAPATLVGGYLGARVARRIDDRVLRWGVVGFAVVVAAYLAVK